MDMQNVKSLEIPEGYVKTIHDKDSRLLWGAVGYDTKYAGDTFQQTYSGKNLFNKDTTDTKAINGATYSTLSTGVKVTNSGGSNWGLVLFMKLNASDYVGKTITFSANAAPSSTNVPRIAITLFNEDVSTRTAVGTVATGSGNLTASYTVASVVAATPYIGVSLYGNFQGTLTNTLYVDYTNAQLEVGPATSYEPYTGGPAPNPDYPQPIQVVTGTQNVWVHGKNMLHGMSTTTATNNGVTHTWDNNTVTFSGSASGGYSNVTQNNFGTIPAGTYTFSTPTPSGVFKTNLRVRYDGTNYNYTIPKNGTSVTFTIPKEASTYLIYIDGLTAGTQVSGVYSYMLERNSTATTYEPYQGQSYPISLGSIELCKIGTYQDYIYKSGDDWYVHKETVKMMMGDITTTWGKYNNGSYYNTSFASTYGFMSATTYSNIFTYNSTSWAGNGKFGINASGALWIMTGDSSLDNASNVPTWLQNKNAVMYGVLATPTDTKITDATLIGQLNAVHEWLTRYGYNATVSGNLPLIVDRTNL